MIDVDLKVPLPQSPDAERSILGGIMLEPRFYHETTEQIDASDFFLDSHRRIYASLAKLIDAGSGTELTLLCQALADSKELELIGGAAYLSTLTYGLPRRPSIEQYAKIIREKAELRRIIHACSSAIAQAAEPGETPEVCIEGLETVLLETKARSTGTKALSLTDLIPDVVKEFETLRSRHDGLIGCTTGITDLDAATTGIRRGEFWVIGAATSRGKTVLATQIAIENAKQQGIPTMLLSYEMTCTEIVKRVLSGETNIKAYQARDPRQMNAAAWADFRESAVALAVKNIPLFMEDLAATDIRTLISKTKLAIKRHGIGLIVVDYLQKITGPGKEERQRVSAASNALRLLAKTENVAVVACSQLRRPERENDVPSLMDLKETGDIENDAHTVLLIYRPKNDDHGWSGKDMIYIAKQRAGITGPQPVYLHEDRLRFFAREKDWA